MAVLVDVVVPVLRELQVLPLALTAPTEEMAAMAATVASGGQAARLASHWALAQQGLQALAVTAESVALAVTAA